MTSGDAPAATTGVARSLCFRYRRLAPLQSLLGALALEYFLCQLPVGGRQLAGPLYDALFKFFIQALDFSLSLFVPCGFDNIPIPASLGYRKLMGSHHIQDFTSSARGEW